MTSLTSNDQLRILQEIAWQGSRKAAESLGLFSGNALTVRDASIAATTVEALPYLHGDPEEVVVGIDFAIEGDIDGFLLAFFYWQDAAVLLESLLGTVPSGPLELDDMALSALGEAGNVIVSSYLIALEELCGLQVLPSPPMVATEMCGAVLTSAAMPVMAATGDVLAIRADIVPVDEGARAACCHVLFLPTAVSWGRLQQAFAGVWPQAVTDASGGM